LRLSYLLLQSWTTPGNGLECAGSNSSCRNQGRQVLL
jgi:hypothetical protein